jgi:hypothetical protein
VWAKAALRASRAGLPAFVPSVVPDGWAVTAAAFDRAAMTWSMELTDGAGDTVMLTEAKGAVEPLVEQAVAGARKGDPVDLRDFGTGTWQSWSAGADHGLSLTTKRVSVLLTGSDPAALQAVAKTLLTADDAAPDSSSG